ncbi:MAG TPA: TadE/TadG family type IV pilus assembly protein [Acetobacteraceae bacterium]|nr:TadE/TadG family type IV pilus assembly protein [Acetobacteraceae bacterium]
MFTAITHTLTQLRQDRRGVSAVEFAIIGTMLATLLLAAYDFGNAAQQQIQLQEAVRSGGAFATRWPTNVSGIQNAVSSALPASWVLTTPGGVATVACSCLDPSTGNVTALPGCATANFDTCTSGSGLLISVTATMAYTSIDTLFASAIPNLSATYVTRFQ